MPEAGKLKAEIGKKWLMGYRDRIHVNRSGDQRQKYHKITEKCLPRAMFLDFYCSWAQG
jgi:hypothetical protein